MEIFSKKEAPKIKIACKILRQPELEPKASVEISRMVGAWLSEDLKPEGFSGIARPFFNAWFWGRSKLDGHSFIFPPLFEIWQTGKFFENEECLRLLKAILKN